MKPDVMIERGSTRTGDKSNDETFTTWKKKKENNSGFSRLVNEALVTTQEETL